MGAVMRMGTLLFAICSFAKRRNSLVLSWFFILRRVGRQAKPEVSPAVFRRGPKGFVRK